MYVLGIYACIASHFLLSLSESEKESYYSEQSSTPIVEYSRLFGSNPMV